MKTYSLIKKGSYGSQEAVGKAGWIVEAGSLIFMSMWKNLSSLFKELLIHIGVLWIGDDNRRSNIRLEFDAFIK